jgi:hypothetical protein
MSPCAPAALRTALYAKTGLAPGADFQDRRLGFFEDLGLIRPTFVACSRKDKGGARD